MQNDLELIKEEIYNCGYVVPLLESLGCDINPSSTNRDRIEAARPGGSNNRSVQVKLNESLPSTVRTKSHIPIGDIYDLVSYIRFGKETEAELRKCLPQSKKYIVETLGLKQFNTRSTTVQEDPNAWLKEIQRKRKKRIDLDEIEPNPILPETVLDKFVMSPHLLFLKDGIDYDTQIEFEIGFDIHSERVIFPIRNVDGKIVGVKGRATRREDENKYKYLPIYSYQKSREWFNLHRAIDHIRKSGVVICFESEKSCMKAYGMEYFNTVSQQGSDVTRVQAEILKRISPDVRVILAYDKDKTPKEVKQMAQVFGRYDNLYGIIDTKGLLDEKQSPVDAGRDVFEKLLHECCFKIFPK